MNFSAAAVASTGLLACGSNRSVTSTPSTGSGTGSPCPATHRLCRGPAQRRGFVDLIEAGLESREAEKERFFSLVSRLTQSKNTAERQRLKEELARRTFGE
jgi:hypothetical protein